MTDKPGDLQNETIAKNSLSDGWGSEWKGALCAACGWAYLMPASLSSKRCPHCSKDQLQSFENPQMSQPPELLLDFSVTAAELEASIHRFADGIPFAPLELKAEALRKRLRRVFLPMWLVDSRVRANWSAEVGFNYQVVSHQEEYKQNRGAWTSNEVEETRIRWEPRLGRLEREYPNLAAPALEAHAQLKSQLGTYDLESVSPYQPGNIAHSFVRLPDRPTSDAWSDALPGLQAAAMEECRRASGADHIRQFSWQPEFESLNWTLLLLPAYASYYLDDEGDPQQLLIHGQTGALHGKRRASLKRAGKTTVGLLITAAILFMIGLLLATAGAVLPPALALGLAVVGLAFLFGIGSLVPLAMVWMFNRGQSESGPLP